MTLSNKPFETMITCGSMTQDTTKFSRQSSINEIREYISEVFASCIPTQYGIQYYDTNTMSIVDFRDQFREGLSPFQTNPAAELPDLPNTIHIFVVKSVIQRSKIASRTNGDQIVSDDSSPKSNVSENCSAVDSGIRKDYDNEEYFMVPSSPTDPSQKLQITSENRLSFSLNVKSKQRDIYRSDQFRIHGSQPNGRIQGVKEDHQKMFQVLPRLRIPSAYHQSDTTLVVAVVTEYVKDGMRVWCKHPDKGFLPKGYTRDTKAINPIELNFVVDGNGQFPLSLQMITKWDKTQQEPKEFYQFDERIASRLYPQVPEQHQSPRLFCVLKRKQDIDWKTFCLSDFIQPLRCPSRRSRCISSRLSCSSKLKRLKQNQ